MNRRQFFRAATVGATAVTVTSVAGGWSLERLRTWLAKLFPPLTEGSFAFVQHNARYSVSINTVSELSALYRRTMTKLYSRYSRRVPAYGWCDAIDAQFVDGRDFSIPLILGSPA